MNQFLTAIMIYYQKLWLDFGFSDLEPSQSCHWAIILGLAWPSLFWLGPWPEARPETALCPSVKSVQHGEPQPSTLIPSTVGISPFKQCLNMMYNVIVKFNIQFTILSRPILFIWHDHMPTTVP
jgi:hypothetical protein